MSGQWVKICGLTTAEAVTAALDAGADAIGFVFAASVRRMTPADAARLARPARAHIPCVAVMRHPAQHEVDEVLEGFAPDVLQTDAADFGQLRLPRTLERLAVLRGAPQQHGTLPARVLFEGAVSGSGALGDWSAAAVLARRVQLVLAGGLTAENVAAAIEAVHPFGVDVSSGVEASAGRKSPAAIARFVSAARTAWSNQRESV